MWRRQELHDGEMVGGLWARRTLLHLLQHSHCGKGILAFAVEAAGETAKREVLSGSFRFTAAFFYSCNSRSRSSSFTLRNATSSQTLPEEVETVFSDVVKSRVADAAFRKALVELRSSLISAKDGEEVDSILSRRAPILLKPELWLLLLDTLRSGFKPALALQVFEWKKKQSHATFLPQEYALVIRVAGKLGRLQTVKALYEEMHGRGVQRTIEVENAYMFAHAYDVGHSDCMEALKVFQRLRDSTNSNLKPNLVSYNTALSCYSKLRHLQHLEKTLDEMIDTGCSPSVETYNCLMLAYRRLGIWWRMEEVFCMMRDASHKPNALTFRTLIRGYAAAGLLDRMESAHEEMLKRGFPLKATTAEAIVAAYKKVGEFSKMEKILFIIKAKRFQSGMSKLMLRSHACNDRMHSMEALLEDAMKNGDIAFSPALAVIVIKAYFKKREDEKIEIFLNAAEACGWNLNRSIFNTLIYLYGKDGHYTKMEWCFERMLASRCQPNLRTFQILLRGYQKGNLDEAVRDVLSRMKAAGFDVSAGTK